MNINADYIAVTGKNGKLIAYIDKDGEIIRINEIKVFSGYGEPIFEDINGEIYLKKYVEYKFYRD